mmetsp:Transcript_58068/g.168511  ORF Transcript_58068/g.168511 Transcript_58068/m.168511 type:complete len:394 (+) Transcript_58068:179-1360(+)
MAHGRQAAAGRHAQGLPDLLHHRSAWALQVQSAAVRLAKARGQLPEAPTAAGIRRKGRRAASLWRIVVAVEQRGLHLLLLVLVLLLSLSLLLFAFVTLPAHGIVPHPVQASQVGPHDVIHAAAGHRLTARLAEDSDGLHLQVQIVALRRPRVRPHTALVLAVEVELLPLLVHVLSPGLELPVGLPLGVLALPAQSLQLSELVLLRHVAVSEAHDPLVRIPVELLQGVRPRARVRLNVVVEHAVGAVMVLRPLGWQRSVEALLGDPHQVAVRDRIDAQIPGIGDELRLRGLQALFPLALRSRHELVHGQGGLRTAALRRFLSFCGSVFGRRLGGLLLGEADLQSEHHAAAAGAADSGLPESSEGSAPRTRGAGARAPGGRAKSGDARGWGPATA